MNLTIVSRSKIRESTKTSVKECIFLAQLWKETCDGRLENKKLKREWTRYPEHEYSVTDNLVENISKDKFMSVKSKEEGIHKVELDSKSYVDTKTQNWTKSDNDEDGYFTLTNPHYGKLLTAKKRDQWTLEGTL